MAKCASNHKNPTRKTAPNHVGQYLAGGQADFLAKLINGGFTIETFFISL